MLKILLVIVESFFAPGNSTEKYQGKQNSDYDGYARENFCRFQIFGLL